ncbi:MAG: hypothetical protein AB1505_20980 [Candidatus Latescibacterota bacterium]
MEEQERDQERAPDLGLVGRMVRVVFAPGETFEAVRLRVGWPDWLIPTLLVVGVGVGALQLTMPAVQRTQAALLAEKLKDMPAE